MFCEGEYLGCPRGVDDLRSINDRLNARVIDQLNESQELVMINSFARETNEYQFKNCLQERISDISSWRWVFEDLSKRIEEAIEALKYEHNALRVVVERLTNEIEDRSRDASKPGALCPMQDSVEKNILEEYNFLREEKKNFEKIIAELDKQMKCLERTKKRIQEDILKKQEAITVENSCANVDFSSVLRNSGDGKKKRKRFSSLARWENRCVSLKRLGLQALTNAVVTRQQVRGARVHLSITAQSHASKVDAAIRRRLHANTSKLEELCWQREEAIKDMNSLNEELIMTEKSLVETMEQERLVAARLADRKLRPPGELTKDDVDRKLKDELGRLRHFMKHLRSNLDRISTLQNHLSDSVARMDCYAEDISLVVRLDQDRMNLRLGEEVKCESQTSTATAPSSYRRRDSPHSIPEVSLTAIMEEDENDYPFND
ncbi:unnamed protein product [Chilo suppressalis]|uniref:Tektin n=1 Tax=Chilo suppressalis TaxID=168631 RepID=A0ABN8ARX7_CHISP|nr:unnamed protein product [Chilo suppressalis]